MRTKKQKLAQFHNAVGLAITENLCDGDITPQDILDEDFWTPAEIADVIKESISKIYRKAK